VTKPVVLTVSDQTGQLYDGVKIYVYDGTTYTSYNGQTDGNGQAIFTLPQGSYRFRADYTATGAGNDTQFWSGDDKSCTLPGCSMATVSIPGGWSQPTNVTIDYTYDPLYLPTAADYLDGTYFHYTYDSVGNRLTQDANLSSQPASTSYTHDSANRLIPIFGADGRTTEAYNSMGECACSPLDLQ